MTKVTANSIEELADKLEDVNRDALIETIKTFNASITRDVPFSPNVKDGRRTQVSPFQSRTGRSHSRIRRSRPTR